MDNAAFEVAVAAFKADREQGASELARQALRIMGECAVTGQADTSSDLVALLEQRVQILTGARPSMVPVANLLQCWQTKLSICDGKELKEARVGLAEDALDLIRLSEDAVTTVAKNAAGFLGAGKTLFTHSLSSTVLELFRKLQGQNVQAIITESRPLNEGYKLAKELAGLSMPTTLITEAQIGLFIEKADVVVMGADSLLPDGSLINKTGSYLVALAAREQDVPFYVCCESFKQRTDEMGEPILESMDPAELSAPVIEGVTVENCYFDITPVHLISGWIDEIGVRLSRS